MTEWRSATLGELVDRVAVKNAGTAVTRVMTVSAAHGLIDQEKFFTKSVASANLSTYYVLQPGDFVYNKSTSKDAEFGVVARLEANEAAVVTPLYIPFRAKPNAIEPDFLLLACNGGGFFGSLAGMLREGARSHGLLNVRLSEFFSAIVALPEPKEQRRIVAVAAVVDAQIKALAQEEAKLEAALVQTREFVMRSHAEEFGWRPIGQVVREVKRPVTVCNSTLYDQIGVRSHGRGIFTKAAVTGEVLGSKKIFSVEPSDLVINIVFGWEGAVAVVPSSVRNHCASHRFPTFVRDDQGPIEYVRHFLLSRNGLEKLGLASPGGAGRNRTLNRTRLMSFEMPSAPLERQRDAAAGLVAIEEHLRAVASEARSFRTVRARLLSALLAQEISVDAAVDKLVKPA